MPKIHIHNAETGEIIEREMNAEELKQRELDKVAIQEAENAENAAKEAKQALLNRLGITAQEAKLLFS